MNLFILSLISLILFISDSSFCQMMENSSKNVANAKSNPFQLFVVLSVFVVATAFLALMAYGKRKRCIFTKV